MKLQIKSEKHMLALLGLLVWACNSNNIDIENMRCEYQAAPMGIDSPAPRFTWNYTTSNEDETEFSQNSYQLCIATREQDLGNSSENSWQSDTIYSGIPYAIYQGAKKLKPRTRYYWQVTAWDKTGNHKITSPISSFETAQINQSDWTGVWITDNHDKDYPSAPMLRKSFTTQEKIQQARLYVSAAAYYKMTLNGQPVTSSHLNPGFTHYDKRNLYNTYDVTSLLHTGENVLSAVLGNGFYNEAAPVATWSYEQARWRNRPRMICEMHISYTNGEEQIITSDSSWKTATGPYAQNNIYSGDTYDARLAIAGWNKPGFDDSKWTNAIQVDAPSPLLISQNMPAIATEQFISPVNMRSFGDTAYVYDFGVNMSGVCTLSINGEKGTKVDLQHGELLKDNGRLEMRNLDIYYKPLPGLAFQTDTYILDGEQGTFTPDFTYHGFQYVEVRSDRPVKLTKESLTAQFIHTAVPPAGNFSCSNELLNKIWKAANQSYLSNLMSIPTDCPQREKNGWTADAHITMDLGLLNFDGITFYEKWLDDMVDNQNEEGRISGIIPSSGWGYDDWIGPVWDAAMFIVPMSIYHYYGDTKSIEKIWPVCVKYLDYLAGREDTEGTVTYGIGDWVFYQTQTPTAFTTTCYYYLDHLYMAKFAELIGKDGNRYAKKAEELKALINQKYFDQSKAIYANGSQAAQGVALYLGIVPKEYEQQVADNLSMMIKANNNLLDFGVLGSKTVLRMLSKHGYADLAYQMAAQEEAPSWGNWIKQGFTTLGETWILSPEFRDASVNHMFLGDVNAWMYNVLAGINYDEQEPGFKHILIQPHFVKGLDWVKAEYKSVNGIIRSEWERKGEQVILKVTIPVNTNATVECNGKKIDLGSGKHQLTF
ncbi:family 78 glycoside hydrolase catalytic domain [Bacteroides xylanisolvens]|uniref:family 78 glycoside hydrolase catalytic domain n=1 Tax=Bacteroides xylanisolvens TaxID=371601 RepID=UPI00189BEF41|nr:family 78 glycoside hydrolase catalytic domain [Bacteroides xylanisolvens]